MVEKGGFTARVADCSAEHSTVSEPLLNQNTDADSTERSAWRFLVAFWLLGVFNNSSFVIMIAGAKSISEASVGIVFIAATLPGLFMKLTSTCWFDRVSCRVRMIMASAMMAASFLILGITSTFSLQIFAVMLASAQCSLGEASLLARSSQYGDKSLTMWSSGTGVAGIFGYLWTLAFPEDEFKLMMLSALSLCVMYAFSYFVLLGEAQVGAAPAPNASLNGSPIESREGHKLSAEERLKLTVSLWPFMVPLFIVYIAEYSLQSGVWSAIGFPVTDTDARSRFYKYSNLAYQSGVVISRSSGILWQPGHAALWVMPFLQCAMLAAFAVNAVYHVWYSMSVLVPCVFVGFLGGAVYVNCFRLLKGSDRVATEDIELATATASGAMDLGTMAASFVGIVLQACIYQANGLELPANATVFSIRSQICPNSTMHWVNH